MLRNGAGETLYHSPCHTARGRHSASKGLSKWGKRTLACGDPINAPQLSRSWFDILVNIEPTVQVERVGIFYSLHHQQELSCRPLAEQFVGFIMLLVGVTLSDAKSEYPRFMRYSHSAKLMSAVSLAVSLVPGSAIASSEKPRSSGVATANAKIVRPFSMTATVPATARQDNNEVLVTTRTTLRDCAELLGADVKAYSNTGTDKAHAALCELKLIELQ